VNDKKGEGVFDNECVEVGCCGKGTSSYEEMVIGL